MYKLSLRQFHVGGVVLPYPDWLRALPLPQIAGVVFAFFLVAWIGKTTPSSARAAPAFPRPC